MSQQLCAMGRPAHNSTRIPASSSALVNDDMCTFLLEHILAGGARESIYTFYIHIVALFVLQILVVQTYVEIAVYALLQIR